MTCCLCGSSEHTSPHCRWLNIYLDKNGKFHCSEIGFASHEAAHNVGTAHGQTYVATVGVPLHQDQGQ
ncbi:hypothetical protein [Ralstonia sp. CP]|uniref:hypothetical protein n=1 Tax=Ralstonia sp. CP TaxID=3231757 RepID=UPI00345B6BF4